MPDSRRLTAEQIRKLVFGITSLDQHQRETVREMLMRLHDAEGGIIYRSAVKREMHRLRETFALSEIDAHNVEHVLFA